MRLRFRDLSAAVTARALVLVALAALFAPPSDGSVVSAGTPPSGLPVQSAGQAGFSPERLKKVETLLRNEIEAAKYAGATWLVARDGKVVTHGAAGFRDVAQRDPMTIDTVFRIYSMTKIVTSVAALTLLEDGRFSLDDAVSRYLPALGRMMVLTGGTADAPQLAPARRPITIRHLLTHTSGFGYDVLGRDEVQREIYRRAELWKSSSLKEFVTKAARLPLAHHPGESYTYGINTDLLGALVEAVTGQPLETVMRERIFARLGMNATTFRVDAAMIARMAKVYRRTPDKGLEVDLPFGIDFSEPAGSLPSGGGGLVSTLHDYARFAQMLLNGGELDRVRVLGRKTIEMMTRNHIGQLSPRPAGAPAGFGLGVYVLQEADSARHLYSPGQFGWSGAASTFVTMDPKERVVALLMLQHQPLNEHAIFERFMNTVYQALDR